MSSSETRVYTTSHLTFATSPPTARVAASCVKASPASQPASQPARQFARGTTKRSLARQPPVKALHPSAHCHHHHRLPSSLSSSHHHPNPTNPPPSPPTPGTPHHPASCPRLCVPSRAYTACLALPAQGVLFRLRRASVSACFHPSPLCSFTTRRPRLSQGLPTAETSDGRRRYV